MAEPTALVWFRKDLRISDNPALANAIESGLPVHCLYLLETGKTAWQSGEASKWWLHHALEDLRANLKRSNLRLTIRSGSPEREIPAVLAECNATHLYWNRRYDSESIKVDTQLKSSLTDQGFSVTTSNAALLHEPFRIQNKSGKPFKVFTPFWKTCLTRKIDLPTETRIHDAKPPKEFPETLALEDLGLLPTIKWDATFYEYWTPTEAGAHAALESFAKDAVCDYDLQRDIPSTKGTSTLSPFLASGQISPRQIWAQIARKHPLNSPDVQRYLSEIGWREFAYHLLFHFPHTTDEPLREEFKHFPWKRDEADLEAWKTGQTGYPMVDAGMRELWATGWMHNRVRMIVASFLVKHLLQPWQEGAKWFWDTLVDADLASNSLGWQWTAGCGADASPYFRVFNPIGQGEKFDAEAVYIKKWVPELSKLPTKYIHRPWDAPKEILEYCQINYGEDYPEPIISHFPARERALEAYHRLKNSKLTA
ncbi:MAG: deoxyribodipyrimidine photo-lyase [Verrucomicrobiota bacterium]